MKFRTEIEVLRELDFKPVEKVLSLGSCFADKVGGKFKEIGFPALVNPFGVSYNPVSLGRLLQRTLSRERQNKSEWQEHEGVWVNTQYHGMFSRGSLHEALSSVEECHHEVLASLKNTNLLILTFGTAFVYESRESGEIVNNCHRLPAKKFSRRLLSVSEVVDFWKELVEDLLEINPQLKIVLTVSPIRHVRDSLIQNQQSKSTLHLAVHELCEVFSALHYFPSYEIMIDDLRDYRFYREDLVQPNSQALEYIWQKFQDFSFSEEMKAYVDSAKKMRKLMDHRSFATGVELESFEESRAQKLRAFYEKYPFAKF